MILVDANLLIYAVDADSPHHERAREWWEEVLSGTTPVGLPWISVLAFLRLSTKASVFVQPLTPERALSIVDSWLKQPYVRLIAPGERHWPMLRNLLQATGMGGNLTSDAHVAALALEYGATVASADRDFGRFPGIRHLDPLTAS